MDNTVKISKPSLFLKMFGMIQGVPTLKYAFFKMMYSLVSRGSLDKEVMAFMNYGYSSDEFDQRVQLLDQDQPDKYSIQLYEYLLRDANLEGQRVLEVGSGRGGGVSYIARYRKPNEIVGIDFSRSQVKHCQRAYDMKNGSFKFGNAMDLPVKDGTCDAVINVESSHCYPDLGRFFREVHRVLRTKGVFYYSDFIPVGSAESPPNVLHVIREKLENAGFEIIRAEDITENVVNALLKTDAAKRDFFERDLSNSLLSTTVHDLLATTESESFRLFKDGVSVYYSICACKP